MKRFFLLFFIFLFSLSIVCAALPPIGVDPGEPSFPVPELVVKETLQDAGGVGAFSNSTNETNASLGNTSLPSSDELTLTDEVIIVATANTSSSSPKNAVDDVILSSEPLLGEGTSLPLGSILGMLAVVVLVILLVLFKKKKGLPDTLKKF